VTMKVLILGSQGMLGPALMQEAAMRNIHAIGMDKHNADVVFDITNDAALVECIETQKPDVIINTVAIIDHELCEKNPGLAYTVNARPAGIIAKVSRAVGAYFIQISTDHFYSGDGDKKHTETDPVLVFNEYSRTKYLAEQLTVTNNQALIVRTNIVGFRWEAGRPTFAEWVIKSLENNDQISLFNDYYTSSIDVQHFAKILFDLLPKRPAGILNIASSQVSSKKDFIASVAYQLGHDVAHLPQKSVFSLQGARRAESLGLDVSNVEKIVGYAMPDRDLVTHCLIKEYKKFERKIL